MSLFKGKKIQLEIYGESHSDKIGANVVGFPKIKIDREKLDEFIQRRKAINSVYSTTRKEPDTPIFKGVKNNVVKGKFKVEIKNTNVKSGDYSNLLGKPRPSHADYTWHVKDGVYDFSGGGRFSARLTAPLCVVGAIAVQYLNSLGIKIDAFVSSIGKVNGISYKDNLLDSEKILKLREGDFPSLNNKQEMLEEINQAKLNKDSVGGTIDCVVSGLKAGIGDNLFSGLEGKIAQLVYSIPAVKGVEFGAGFNITKMRGSVANDSMYYDENKEVLFESNNAGGINGGITNGNQITLSVAFRPTPSIGIEQKTIDLINKTNTTITVKGRHDSCIVPRAVPCVESAVALAILDEIL